MLAVGVAFGLAVASFFLLNAPLKSWRHDINRRSELVREQLARGPAMRRRLADLREEHEKLLASVDEVSRRLPDQPREGEFLADLTRIAAAHEVVVEDFRRGEATKKTTHSVVTVTITAQGAHRGLCAMIDEVSKLPRLAELVNLDVQSNPDDDRYPVRMTYALYYGMATPPVVTTAAL